MFCLTFSLPLIGITGPPYKMCYNDLVTIDSNTLKDIALEDLRRRASSLPAFRGRGGLTDRDVYRSLIEVGQEHGTLWDHGIRVSVSVRELSRRARISYASTLRSLNERLAATNSS